MREPTIATALAILVIVAFIFSISGAMIWYDKNDTSNKIELHRAGIKVCVSDCENED